MLETDKRKAIFCLHHEGMSAREIARRLGVSRNTVRVVIAQEGAMPQSTRSVKVRIDEELLRKLYQQCEGRVQRVHEKLVEEENISVTYSTLTRLLRALQIGQPSKTRCDRVPDQPGVEMQHDTSTYVIAFKGEKVRVVASLLYLRYSKRRYLKFYRSFERFKMKCFFHEALMYWGYSATHCIIDNTNLARLRGSGKNALIVPEMESFSRQYAFSFHCHEIKHSDRKAGEERSFWTVETNFFPGRIFESLEDLNQQALEWSTVRLEHRPQGKAKLIPAKAFEYESGFLTKLPRHLPAPYRVHNRSTDQYGYVSFHGNFYWVPGTTRDDIRVVEYSATIALYRARENLIEYPLPADGVRNKVVIPEGTKAAPPPPQHQPHNRKDRSDTEEQQLRAIAESVSEYVDFALAIKGVTRHDFLRKLARLSRTMTQNLFTQSIERAHRYKITDIEVIERIAVLTIGGSCHALPSAEVDAEFEEREAYREGAHTESPDMSVYDDIYTDNAEEQYDQDSEE